MDFIVTYWRLWPIKLIAVLTVVAYRSYTSLFAYSDLLATPWTLLIAFVARRKWKGMNAADN